MQPTWFMDAPKNKTLIPFPPVPVRARHDGWTIERQYNFIETLAETGCVEAACRRVGMSDTAAYNLRRRHDGRYFRRAWVAALDYSDHRLEQDARMRSRRGVARPIFYKGEQIGEWRHFDERLTMFFLRTRRPDRYGRLVERMPGPDEQSIVDPAMELDESLDSIEWEAEDVPAEDDDGDQIEPRAQPGAAERLPGDTEQPPGDGGAEQP